MLGLSIDVQSLTSFKPHTVEAITAIDENGKAGRADAERESRNCCARSSIILALDRVPGGDKGSYVTALRKKCAALRRLQKGE